MNSRPTIAIVLGTRPEIIKCAPVLRACEERDIPYTLIHTGQHYSNELDEVFFTQLELPAPDYNLEVGSATQGKQTGTMIAGIEEVLLSETPDVVLVQGDTNSTLAGAIATSKLEAELGHIEAGLRSFDRTMPEEMNRILTDHAADYLYAPTEGCTQHLAAEGLAGESVHITGNTIVDAVQQHKNIAAQKSSIHQELDLEEGTYVLMTAHRAENVDDRTRFAKLLEGARQVAEQCDLQVIYPMHPRAKHQLEQFSLTLPDEIRCIEPLSYLDFLLLEKKAALILTDSGGVQEEACILGVPCVTMRENTERPETVEVGANRIAGTAPAQIVTAATEILAGTGTWENPFGDGTAAVQLIDHLRAQY